MESYSPTQPEMPMEDQSVLSKSSHPIALIFHLAFKALSIFLFVFGNYVLGSSYILIFIGSVLSLAFDFWTTKNVSGRLLVGLRCWSLEDQWHFESRPNYTPNGNDSFVFWAALIGIFITWIVMSFLYLFSPQWLVICLVGVILSGSNLYGYYKCKNYKGPLIPSMPMSLFGAFASQPSSNV